VDAGQADALRALGLAVHVAPTLMLTTEHRRRLALEVLAFADSLSG